MMDISKAKYNNNDGCKHIKSYTIKSKLLGEYPMSIFDILVNHTSRVTEVGG